MLVGLTALLLLPCGSVSSQPTTLVPAKLCRVFSICLLWLFLVAPVAPLQAQQAGSLDTGFNPGYGVDGDVIIEVSKRAQALFEQADGIHVVFDNKNGIFVGQLDPLWKQSVQRY